MSVALDHPQPITRGAAAPELIPLVASPTPRARRRLGGWPLRLVVAGYVLTWLVGLGEFVFPITAAVMAVSLLRRRKVLVPPRFGWWLAFLAVGLFASVMSVQDVPGTVYGNASGHVLSWALRFSLYLSAGVILLYIGNTDEKELPTLAIVRSMGLLFVFTVLGGYLGMLLPHLELSTPMELLLPKGITSQPQVHMAVHLQTAEVQDFLGYVLARPDAPFLWTNIWGANLGLLMPMFIAGWLTKTASRRRRIFGFLILALALPPIIYSVNRGLWLALLGAGVYVAVRLALLGRARLLMGLFAALVAGALIIAVSPLYGTIQDRLNHGHSDARRGQLATDALTLGLKSPILGWGTTRDSLGSGRSITAGQSTDCKACGLPPVGTHGQLYLLVFSTGVLGAALYLMFVFRSIGAYWRLTDPVSLAAQTVLAVALIEMFFYELVGSPLVYIFVALGVLWRMRIKQQRSQEQEGPGSASRSPLLVYESARAGGT